MNLLSIFSLNKNSSTIAKLFKIVDRKNAPLFDIKECCNMCMNGLDDLTGFEMDRFEFNFQSRQYTRSKFLQTIRETKNEDITVISGSKSRTPYAFNIENPMINFDPKPSFAYLGIHMCLPLSVDIDKTTSLMESLIRTFQFQYGYIGQIGKGIDYINESRLDKRFDESDLIWRKYMYAMLEGFLKKVYPVNILNSSQLENPIIKKLIDRGVGRLSTIGSLAIWKLSDQEVIESYEALKRTKVLIENDFDQTMFLNCEELPRFERFFRPI